MVPNPPALTIDHFCPAIQKLERLAKTRRFGFLKQFEYVTDDGRIVADTNGTATRTIHAAGMVIFPGGVDVHTHVAGGALNFARGLVPENQRVARKFMHTPELRTGIGGMTPTTFATGYLYAGMGWTTVNEAAVPILSAKHTHEEMHDIPIVDK